MSRELTKEILTVPAWEKPFHYLQKNHRDNIISSTNGINKQFNDELEKWRLKDGTTRDVKKEFPDEFENWRRKNGPTKDVNKEFHDELVIGDVRMVLRKM
jgi:hypothetical protein